MEGCWHLRLHTHCLGDLSEFASFLRKYNTVYLMAKEIGEKQKEHLHIYVKPHTNKSTMIQQLKRQYPKIDGNKDYSCRKITETPENFVKYCCKGENKNTQPCILVNDGHFDIVENHKQFWLKNDELKSQGVNMGCQNDPPKKVKTLSWTEKVYLQIQTKYQNEISIIQAYAANPLKKSDFEIAEETNARRVIFRHMMKCFGKTVKKLNGNIVTDTFCGFMNAIIQENDVAGEKYSDKMFDHLILNKY